MLYTVTAPITIKKSFIYNMLLTNIESSTVRDIKCNRFHEVILKRSTTIKAEKPYQNQMSTEINLTNIFDNMLTLAKYQSSICDKYNYFITITMPELNNINNRATYTLLSVNKIEHKIVLSERLVTRNKNKIQIIKQTK